MLSGNGLRRPAVSPRLRFIVHPNTILMETNTIIGILILLGALSTITYLTLWSRKTIQWIDSKGSPTTREIIKELDREE